MAWIFGGFLVVLLIVVVSSTFSGSKGVRSRSGSTDTGSGGGFWAGDSSFGSDGCGGDSGGGGGDGGGCD